MKKFKAVILEKINEPLLVSEIESTPLKAGQVLVKILSSGICGAQLLEMKGLKGNANFVPHLLGHEGCGIVDEIGDGVKKVKVGDKVVMHWRVSEGIESDFPEYIYNGRKISSGKVTTLSEYSIVSENRLTPVPSDSSENLCSLLGCGLTTALGTINNEAEIKFGESVLIIGCGGVGLNLIQGSKMASAYPIVGVDLSTTKENIVKSMGASHFFSTNDQTLTEQIKQENLDKFDVIIDTTGNVEVINEAMELLSNQGRFIMVGQPKPGQELKISNAYNLFSGYGKKIKATQGGKTIPQQDIPRYIKLFNSGNLKIENVITHTFKLDQINEAFDLLKSGNAGRIIIKM